uniref:Retrovirus-related Pol polyprotein from transposon TNT 1-94 n=1 Tax=Tanacetum cinerariifolium TaxID=118510 RepID=A0A699H4S9_TANCI|nr:hypothetical protein [Tanacetum cinerariifolium]
MLLMQAHENEVVLDEEQLLFIAGGQDSTFDNDVDETPVQDLALNTMFMGNLSSADPIYVEASPSYDSDILSEVQDHDNYLDKGGGYHEVHDIQNDVQQNYVIAADAGYKSDSNIIMYEQYVKNNAKQVVQINVSSVPNDALMMIINDMLEQAAQQNDRFRAENEKVKQHYNELYDSIKIMCAKTIKKTSSLLTKNEKLKARLKGKIECVTMNTVKPKVLASGMYAIDVEPIPPHNRNNGKVHIDYLKHLKECVETLREIVKEVRIEKPLDNALENACFYTKRSQELLEYVIGTCLEEFNKTDKKGVNSFTEANGSKPMSNTKNNRILPAKSDNKKKVEDHPRNNKSNLKQKNHRVLYLIQILNLYARHVTTTTTLPTPQPPPPQSTIDPYLATHISTLEKRTADFKQKKAQRQDNSSSCIQLPPAPPSKQLVNDDQIPVDMHLLESEVTGVAHLPKIKTRLDWLKPLPEEETPETPEPDWIGKKKLVKADFEGQAYKIVRPFHKKIISLQFQMEECHLLLTDQIDLINLEGNRVVYDVSKPLPLGGPPGQVTIQAQYFFNKDLEYLVSGNKERRHALSISKLKAAYYLDFKLKELIPSLWTESESAYDISLAYVRSHMKILSVVSLKTCLRYGYTFLKEIFLRRADYKEYKIWEADFKNLHPSDFKDTCLLNLQGKLNHLSGADKVHLTTVVNLWSRNIVIRQHVEDLQFSIESYQTKLNITQLRWDATDFLYKEDYTIVHKPRVMVKEYKLYKYNPNMENRIWNEDNKQRSQEFIKLIGRRLKIRRMFKSLESFVSGRIRDVDYRLIDITE